MRQRRLKKLWARLHALQTQRITRDQLRLKLGAARKEAGRACVLVSIKLPESKQPVNATTFTFLLNNDKLRVARRREGRYLLLSNLCDEGLRLVLQEMRLTLPEQPLLRIYAQNTCVS